MGYTSSSYLRIIDRISDLVLRFFKSSS